MTIRRKVDGRCPIPVAGGCFSWVMGRPPPMRRPPIQEDEVT